MKRILFAVALLFVLAFASANAQTTITVGSENAFDEDSFTPNAYVYASRAVTKKVGLFGFAARSTTWTEGYAGVIFSPRAWITLSAGAGLEQDSNPWRLGGTFWMGNSKNSLFFVGETGGSGGWWRGVFNHKLGYFGVGAIGQAFLGAGPRVEFTVPGEPLTVWAGRLMEGSGSPSHIIGATFTF